jgi:hypothetical protein
MLNIFLIQLIKFYSDNSIFIFNTLKKSFNPNKCIFVYFFINYFGISSLFKNLKLIKYALIVKCLLYNYNSFLIFSILLIVDFVFSVSNSIFVLNSA